MLYNRNSILSHLYFKREKNNFPYISIYFYGLIGYFLSAENYSIPRIP